MSDEAKAAPGDSASDLYLRGRFVMGHRGEANLRKALEYFERSAASDPDHPDSHIGIAQILGLLSYYGFARPRDVMPRARMAAERAIRLNGDSAEAHAALGFILLTYDWAWDDAEREYRRALDLSPADPDVLSYYGFYYLICLRGRDEEGMELIWRAIGLAPVASTPIAILGPAVAYTGRTEGAIPRIAQAVEGFPSSWILQRSLGLALAAEGRRPEAAAALERAARLSNRYPWTLMDLGTFRVEIEERDAARRIHEELETISRERYLQPMALAAIPAALGDADVALVALRKALEERDGILIVMRKYPPFQDLHSDPRFLAIQEAMGPAEG